MEPLPIAMRIKKVESMEAAFFDNLLEFVKDLMTEI
jgi:hypothetical protein